MKWVDEVFHLEFYHKKMQKEIGAAIAGRPRKSEGKLGWSIMDTADHFKVSYYTAHRMIKLAEFMKGRLHIQLLPNRTAALNAMLEYELRGSE